MKTLFLARSAREFSFAMPSLPPSMRARKDRPPLSSPPPPPPPPTPPLKFLSSSSSCKIFCAPPPSGFQFQRGGGGVGGGGLWVVGWGGLLSAFLRPFEPFFPQESSTEGPLSAFALVLCEAVCHLSIFLMPILLLSVGFPPSIHLIDFFGPFPPP